MIVDLTLAPIATLAFLGFALFVVVTLLLLIVSRIQGKTALTALCAKVLAGGVGLYVVALLGVSAFSKDYTLGRGAEKHYCELDCHIAYSVTKVETPASAPADIASTLPVEAGQLYVVTLRTRFDEKTIGANRGDGPLTPNPRKLFIRDEDGKMYSPAYGIAGTPLDKPLRPGESYETRILFRLPPGARNPRLFLSNSEWPNSFLIGHENSPLHGKAYFDLKG